MLIDYVSTVSKGHLSQMWPVVKVVMEGLSVRYGMQEPIHSTVWLLILKLLPTRGLCG